MTNIEVQSNFVVKANWLEERRKGIGGSDAAAALGVSKWKTQLQLYLEKIGEFEVTQNDAMEWGTRLEPVVRQKYCDVTGVTVHRPPSILTHGEYPWMLANVDGITDHDRLLEVKTSRSSDGWGEPGTDEIPDDYRLQVQHYLCVTGLEVADVAVLIASSDFRIYTVHHDQELADMLIAGEAEFWLRVVNRDPPDAKTADDCRLRWPRSKGDFADVGEHATTLVRLQQVKEYIDDYEQEADDLKAKLMRAIGDKDGLAFNGKPLVTWKSGKPPERFDTKAFRVAFPELYAEYTKTGEPTRTFLLK